MKAISLLAILWLPIVLSAQTQVVCSVEGALMIDTMNEASGAKRYAPFVVSPDYLEEPNLVFRPMSPRFVAQDGRDGPFSAMMWLVTDAAGNVIDAYCAEASDPGFGEYARQQARRWKFKPGTYGKARGLHFISAVAVDQKGKR